MRLPICLLLSFLLAAPAYAAKPAPQPTPSLNIVAVAGEQAISSADVENRTRFIIATANLSNTPEMATRIRPQVLRSLIDESLQSQAATKANITITDKDIADAIVAIESSRGLQSGEVMDLLRSQGIPESTFNNQVRAQLSWNKLVARKARPLVKVTDEEVRIAQQLLATPGVAKEVQISILTLPIDKPEREADMKRIAEKLVAELRRGANFEETARQFSTSSTGKIDAFWIRPEQLDASLASALANAQDGAITDPQRTPEGFTIVKLIASRTVQQEASAQPTLPDADKVRDVIFRQKIELEAQKYLRNLRRESFVEIRDN